MVFGLPNLSFARAGLRLVAVVLCMLVAACLPRNTAERAPLAEGGVIDLSSLNFHQSGPADLGGEWAFFAGLSAEAALARAPERFLVQPGVWKGGAVPAQGRNTLVLTVVLPEDRPLLVLALPDVNSAYRLLVDGVEKRKVGTVSATAQGEVPVYDRPLIPLPAHATRITLALEISNHHHFEGGLGRAVRVGKAENMVREAFRLKGLAMASFGALVIVVLLQLAFWAGGRRDRAFVLFAGFAALMAARSFASGQLYTMFGTDFPSTWWYLLPNYLTLYLFPGLYLAFLRQLFPAEIPGRLVWPMLAVSVVMGALVLAAPSTIYTRFRDPFQLLLLLTPLLGMVLLTRSVLRRRVGAVWILAGSLAMFLALLNDSLHSQRVINSVDLASPGFAALAVGYAAALALSLFEGEGRLARRLAVLNQELEAKVAERTAGLARAKAAAERASEAKSEFLAVMSHEIRTPLHGWGGLIELLEATPLNEAQRRYVSHLRQTADQFGRVIGDILDMSRLEAGELELQTAPFDPGDLAAEETERARPLAEGKGLALMLEMDDGLPEAVMGDARAVRQIISNFLDNAIKFTEAGGIRMQLNWSRGAGLRLRVVDTGRGIPAHRRADIFELFTQVDASNRRSQGGAGLGLALCRRLAEAMGGRCGVDEGPGMGSAFWAELPLPEASPAAVAKGLPRGLKVLIADDAELNRLVLKNFLADTGSIIDEAADGAEAAALATGNRYDLIVLDLRMPRMDGFQAMAAIRAHERQEGRPPVPAAALSAGAMAAARQAALDAGFDIFLAKPIDRTALLAALAALLDDGQGVAAHQLEAPDVPPSGGLAIPPGLEHLLPTFLAEVDKDCVELRKLAVAGVDRSLLAEHVHAMRGKCGMFGERPLFDLLTRLEGAAPSADQRIIDGFIASIVERAGQLAVYEAGNSPAG